MLQRKLLASLAALGLVLAACGEGTPSQTGGTESAPASAEPSVEQVFRVSSQAEPPTLDPTIATDSASIQVLNSVQRPLLWSTPGLEVTEEGGLAESFDVSDDGLVYTFHLREGIAYSNGEPIVAGDFVYSWRRLVDPRVGAGYSYEIGDGFGNVAGAQAALDMAGADELPPDAEIDAALENLGVAAPDDSTFEVTLTQPTGYFPFIASLWFTSPLQQTWVESGDDFTEAENYVSSGPFMLTEWSHEELVVMEPNPEWYGEPAQLSRLEIHILPDAETEFQAYLNDEIDLVAVPAANIQQVKDDPVLSEQAITGDVLCTYYIGFDLSDENDESPVQNKALRHAITQAIDRDALIATVTNTTPTAADSMVPKGMPGHQEGIGPQHFDLEQAQANLETALSELGLSNAGELDLTLAANEGHEDIMEFIQGELQDNLGITVNIEIQEWGSYLESLDPDPPDLWRLGWCQDYPHPHNFLGDVFACGTGNNHARYCNEDYDALLAQGAAETDVAAGLPYYEQAQEILVEDAPAAFIYWYGRYTLVNPRVQGLTPTAGDSNSGDLFYDRVFIVADE
jgi:oligopeptide transport system substrate-binding protein